MNDQLTMVSIICTSYNHEPFIQQCLDGFLMQKCDFNFEVIIHDDASTDNTANIIRQYVANYPNIFKPILQTTNQASQERGRVTKIVFGAAKGKYIAYCEGDDYWADPLKLQKQVDFMEKNQDYGLVFSNCKQYFWKKGELVKTKVGITEVILDREYSRVEIFEKWLIPTASVLFRKDNFCPENYSKIIADKNLINGDIVLFLFMTKMSKIYGMSDVMTVYNRHSGGATLNNSISHIKFINHLNEVIRIFGPEFKTPLIKEIIAKYYFNIAKNEFNKSKINVIKNVIYSFINDPKIILYRIKLKLKDLYK